MRIETRSMAWAVLGALIFVFGAAAQVGNSGSIEGTAKDPSGAVVAKATVEISNPVRGGDRHEAGHGSTKRPR